MNFAFPSLNISSWTLPSVNSIYSSASSHVELTSSWIRQNPQVATVTAIALAALGIIAIATLVSFVSIVAKAVIAGMASLLGFTACCALGYLLVRHTIISIKSMGNFPQNITLSAPVEISTSPQ